MESRKNGTDEQILQGRNGDADIENVTLHSGGRKEWDEQAVYAVYAILCKTASWWEVAV